MSISNAEFSVPLVYREPPEVGRTYGGSRALFREAARQFGVDLTEQEDYEWMAGLEFAKLVDHLVDVEKQDASTSYKEIISGKLRDDLNSDIQVRTINFMARKSLDERAGILEILDEVNTLVTAQRIATKASEVVDIRFTEAELLTSLFALEERGLTDDAARQTFNKWLDQWHRAGYLVDTLFDMRDDFKNGETSVIPTVGAGLHYAGVASRESFTAVRKTPAALIGKCALEGFRYVILQKSINVQDQ